jgi:hypothetical protein
MGRRLDWTKARFVGRPTLDYRREFEFKDRASKWLQVVESRLERQRYERRKFPRSSHYSSRSSSTDWTTSISSAVPW